LVIVGTRNDPWICLLNETPLPAHIKSPSGYVVQEDILIRTLTIRENVQAH
jgi:ABC-type lipoprotein export system ATPase subunit